MREHDGAGDAALKAQVLDLIDAIADLGIDTVAMNYPPGAGPVREDVRVGVLAARLRSVCTADDSSDDDLDEPGVVCPTHAPYETTACGCEIDDDEVPEPSATPYDPQRCSCGGRYLAARRMGRLRAKCEDCGKSHDVGVNPNLSTGEHNAEVRRMWDVPVGQPLFEAAPETGAVCSECDHPAPNHWFKCSKYRDEWTTHDDVVDDEKPTIWADFNSVTSENVISGFAELPFGTDVVVRDHEGNEQDATVLGTTGVHGTLIQVQLIGTFRAAPVTGADPE